MNKQVIITALVLTLFAVLGGGLVALTERSTAEQIALNEKQALLFNLNNILPATEYDNDLATSVIALPSSTLLNTENDSPLYFATKAGKPVAFIFNSVAPGGYSGKIYLLVGIYTNGNIAGVRVVKHKETPGLGDAIEARRSNWILGFDHHSLSGLSEKQWKVKRDGGQFDQFTGATITPRAVVKAVHDTLLYFNQHRDVLLLGQAPEPIAVKEK